MTKWKYEYNYSWILETRKDVLKVESYSIATLVRNSKDKEVRLMREKSINWVN